MSDQTIPNFGVSGATIHHLQFPTLVPVIVPKKQSVFQMTEDFDQMLKSHETALGLSLTFMFFFGLLCMAFITVVMYLMYKHVRRPQQRVFEVPKIQVITTTTPNNVSNDAKTETTATDLPVAK